MFERLKVTIAPITCPKIGQHVRYVTVNVKFISMPFRMTPLEPLRPAFGEKLHKLDWVILAIGSIVVFELANLFLIGLDHGLLPILTKPYLYAGDALFYHSMAQRAMEGWVFNDKRMGYPFGSALYDFPGSDGANWLIFKIIGRLAKSNVAAVNLHVLLSFPAVFATSLVVFRKFGIRLSIAVAFAGVFAFTPYHFARFYYGHTPYNWYVCAPIAMYMGYKLYIGAPLFSATKWGVLKAALIAIVLSSFGVYFAFFNVVLFTVSALAGYLREPSARPLRDAAIANGLVIAGVVLNLLPNVIDNYRNGTNPHGAPRLALETEVYSLKIIHLLLPQSMHRIHALGSFTTHYQTTFPLSNTDSSLGILGVIGFFAALVIAIRALVGGAVDQRMRYGCIIIIASLLICTVGGLNDLFALFVSPLIRGWDRFSIFVAFGVALVSAIGLDSITSRARFAAASPLCATAILAIGLYDQTPASPWPVIANSFARYDVEAPFIHSIEASLPRGAAVYQLPYIPFPESDLVSTVGGYDQLSGFLNSRHLRWSFGGMRGRSGDLFYRDLAKVSAAQQLSWLREQHFSGIYIDRRGYKDQGEEIIADFQKLLGPPSLTRSDGQVVFFEIH